MSRFRPERSDCVPSTVKAARSLADGRAIFTEAQMTEKTPEVYLAGYFFGGEASVSGGSDNW
jgi:hypothetical protein